MPVKRKYDVDWAGTGTPLQIRFKSTSHDVNKGLSVRFKNATGNATVWKLTDFTTQSVHYELGDCHAATVQTGAFKDTLDGDSTCTLVRVENRVSFECMGDKIVDLVLSDQTCVDSPSWRKTWMDVGKITEFRFQEDDTIAAFYRKKPGD